METLPGWHVEDLLDPSSHYGHCKVCLSIFHYNGRIYQLFLLKINANQTISATIFRYTKLVYKTSCIVIVIISPNISQSLSKESLIHLQHYQSLLLTHHLSMNLSICRLMSRSHVYQMTNPDPPQVFSSKGMPLCLLLIPTQVQNTNEVERIWDKYGFAIAS